MLHFKASKFAILATVCLLGIGADRSAHAQAYTVTDLGGLPGSTDSEASGINNAGQVVGSSDGYAIEWSGGSVINLGGLPGSSFSFATGVNDAGQVVGISSINGSTQYATEWSGGSVINLGVLAGSTS